MVVVDWLQGRQLQAASCQGTSQCRDHHGNKKWKAQPSGPLPPRPSAQERASEPQGGPRGASWIKVKSLGRQPHQARSADFPLSQNGNGALN